MPGIEAQLAALNERVRQHNDTVVGKLDDLQQDVGTLQHIITGNGNPERGLATRLARIEERLGIAARGTGWALFVLGAVLATVLTTRLESCERRHVVGTAEAQP
jgi:hypothetical protein